MTKKVRKAFGENPETVAVLATQVTFDAEGFAEVEDEVADVFGQIPGYEVEEIEEAQEAPSKKMKRKQMLLKNLLRKKTKRMKRKKKHPLLKLRSVQHVKLL
jgi:hypothetical protein